MQYSVTYTLVFAAIICGFCSVFVAGAAVSLKDRQEANKILDRQTKVLSVAGLLQEGEDISAAEVGKRFEDSITTVMVELQTGQVVEDGETASFDQLRASKDPATSRPAPDNKAKVMRLPNRALVYQVRDGDAVTALILPIEGKGLWSTLYGFLALDTDLNTIKGITFYQHGETPGLGGEVDNPTWKALWPGRKAFDEDGKPAIMVKKGQAGPVADDPHRVDGLSGATITSRGVTHLVQFWLDDSGFGPYLANYRAAHGVGNGG